MGIKLKVVKVVQKEAGQTTPAPVQPKMPENKPVKFRKIGGRRWWLVGLGGAGVALGILGFGVFASNPMQPNMMIGVPSIFAIIAGGIGIYYGIKKQEEGLMVRGADGKIGKHTWPDANCLNIYPENIAFEELPDTEVPQGHPRRCRNDKRYYFVNIWDTAFKLATEKAEGKLIRLILPDAQYRDPREFANNLNIPAHRRLAQRKASLMEKISPWILVVAIIIIGVIWVATTPAPVTTGG